MPELEVKITGRTTADMEDALDEVKRLVSEGYTCGRDGNERGGYDFTVSGEDEDVLNGEEE